MWGAIVDLAEDILEAVEAPAKAALSVAEAAAEAAADAGAAVYAAIADGIDALIALKDDVVDLLGDVERALVEVARRLGDALERIGSFVADIATIISSDIASVIDAIGSAASDLAKGMVRAIEWLEKNLPDPLDWVLNDVLPAVWGGIKLIVALAVLVALWPAALAAMFICNAINDMYGKEYGKVIQAILAERPRYKEMYKIVPVNARQKIVIFSDIHRWASNDEQEAGSFHQTRALHNRLLDHYGLEGWTLIENGDVEDYWLRGGSFYGMAYDMADILPGPVFDSHFREAGLLGASQMHLLKIVEHHMGAYARIQTHFLADPDNPRYFRTAGNHDDVNRHPDMQSLLARQFPGMTVADYILLKDGDESVGLIAHGHQTDAWNHGACSFLGKITTSLASGVRDLPFTPRDLGLPSSEKATAIWNGPAPDEMDQISPFGADTDLGSLDESSLYDSFKSVWPTLNLDPHQAMWASSAETTGPWVVLGHTHTPLKSPTDPASNGVWYKYLNTGCSIFDRMITAIEWVWDDDSPAPEVRLVAWRWTADAFPRDPGEKGSITARRLYRSENTGKLAPEPINFTLNVPLPLDA